MDLYSEIILDHYKNPQNSGQLEDPTISITEHNPLCGDKIHLDLKLDPASKTVTAIAHNSEGCAISQAAMSLISDEIIGKTLQEIKDLDNQIVYDLLGVEISAGRIKCALLGLAAAKEAALKLLNKS